MCMLRPGSAEFKIVCLLNLSRLLWDVASRKLDKAPDGRGLDSARGPGGLVACCLEVYTNWYLFHARYYSRKVLRLITEGIVRCIK